MAAVEATKKNLPGTPLFIKNSVNNVYLIWCISLAAVGWQCRFRLVLSNVGQ